MKHCPSCSGTMELRSREHIEEVGKIRVVDKTSAGFVCANCGEWELTMAELGGYERRAARTVLFKRMAAGPDAYRYARKALGLKQTDLAEILGYRGETVSRWETGSEEMPRVAQLAIAGLIAGVDLGVSHDEFSQRGSSSDEIEVPR